MTAWLVFVLAGLGTYLSRGLFILLIGDRTVSPAVARGLRNIGPAVLAALTASLLTTDGLTEFVTSVPDTAGVVAGIVVGLWRRSFALSFAAAFSVWAALSLLE